MSLTTVTGIGTKCNRRNALFNLFCSMGVANCGGKKVFITYFLFCVLLNDCTVFLISILFFEQ